MQQRGTGKRVERCQRTVLRGQQAPENRCRTQGLKRKRSGGRSSRRTSGTKMPRCRSGLLAARREHDRERRSFRAQRTGPTERPDRRNVRRNKSSGDAAAESVVCLLGEDGQLGSQQPCRAMMYRGDHSGRPVCVLPVRSVARSAPPGAATRARPYSPPKDGPALISVCVRCRDLAVFVRVFPEAAAPRWAKASGRRIRAESAVTVRYR
jgi:hypothetical protein